MAAVRVIYVADRVIDSSLMEKTLNSLARRLEVTWKLVAPVVEYSGLTDAL